MKLVIVESPNKCATIKGYLGDEYKVIASKGNVRDLATSGKDGLGIDVENGFKTNYKIDKTKISTVKMLQKEASEAEEVLLATDPDREGEAISWHLSQILNLDPASTKRLMFQEITGPAIQEAIANPKTINMNLVDSQETRRIYDRVIGFKLSKLLQRKIKCKSAGRVQSATLKMLCDNDKARKNFVPTEYWNVSINVESDGSIVKASLNKIDGKAVEIPNGEQCQKILDRIGENVKVLSIKSETKHVEPKFPFTTSSLAQESFNRFHFSTSTTASVAQKLYEGITINDKHIALISYIRTDSTRISPVFYNEQAKPYITEKYGAEYLHELRKEKKTVGEQGAHEAIRPTDLSMTPEKAAAFLTPSEAKLYKLIYDRTVAFLMKSKIVETTTVVFESNGLTFVTTGSKTLFPGYKILVKNEEEEDDKSLPTFKENASYLVKEKESEQKFTEPPAEITEARLVKMMEKEGIGRPSTYATTIKTLIERSYVVSKKGVLNPTESGHTSTDFLENYFPEIVSTNYTAEMESELDEIQDGTESKLDALNKFYFPFEEKFGQVVTNTESIKPKLDIVEGKTCPKCGAPLVNRKSKYGTFVACSNFPKCDYIEKKEKAEPKYTGELCPQCGKPLVERVSKGKTFVACSGFPKCKYIKGSEATKPTYTEADYIKPCPKCGIGHIVLKKSKRGSFLACTNYPACDYHEFPKSKKSGK